MFPPRALLQLYFFTYQQFNVFLWKLNGWNMTQKTKTCLCLFDGMVIGLVASLSLLPLISIWVLFLAFYDDLVSFVHRGWQWHLHPHSYLRESVQLPLSWPVSFYPCFPTLSGVPMFSRQILPWKNTKSLFVITFKPEWSEAKRSEDVRKCVSCLKYHAAMFTHFSQETFPA